MTAVQFAVQHEARTHARADREEDEIVDASGHAQPAFAQGGQVDVVLERHRHAEAVAQLAAERPALEIVDVRRQVDGLVQRVDDARARR